MKLYQYTVLQQNNGKQQWCYIEQFYAYLCFQIMSNQTWSDYNWTLHYLSSVIVWKCVVIIVSFENNLLPINYFIMYFDNSNPMISTNNRIFILVILILIFGKHQNSILIIMVVNSIKWIDIILWLLKISNTLNFQLKQMSQKIEMTEKEDTSFMMLTWEKGSTCDVMYLWEWLCLLKISILKVNRIITPWFFHHGEGYTTGNQGIWANKSGKLLSGISQVTLLKWFIIWFDFDFTSI